MPERRVPADRAAPQRFVFERRVAFDAGEGVSTLEEVR